MNTHASLLHQEPQLCNIVSFLPSLAKRRAPAPMPLTPAQKITKPAAKYGVPLNVRKASDAAMKPAERKPAVKHKMVSTGGEPVMSFSLLNRMILYWPCIIVYCPSAEKDLFILVMNVCYEDVCHVTPQWDMDGHVCVCVCPLSLNPSVICCSGPRPPPSSTPEESESSGGREEEI